MPAGGFSVSSTSEPPPGTEFEAKITPAVVMSCVMAATGGLLFGCDIGVSGRSPVPVGDVAGEDPRRAQHPVPAQHHHRHPLRPGRQLRHQQDQAMGLEAFAVPCRRPGRAPRGGDAQQPHRARPPRRGQGRAEEDPRHRERGARVQLDRGGQPHRPTWRQAPIPRPAPPPQPPPAHRHRLPPDIPEPHGDQRDRVLRAGPAPNARVQQRRVALLGGDHRGGERAVDAGVGVRSGPGGMPDAAPGRRRVHVPDAGGHGGGVPDQGHRRGRRHRPRLGHHGRRHGLHLRLPLRLVMGPAWVAHPQRDIPAGHALRGPGCRRLRQPALHLRHGANVPLHALSPRTKKVPIEMMTERAWRQHWFWKRFFMDDDDANP